MAINMSRYVRITSNVTGAAAVPTRALTGRRFSTNPLVPVGEIVEVSPGGASDYFGSGSNEAEFAKQYFGYISPSPATRAGRLQFAAYVDADRIARIYGYGDVPSLSDFQSVTSGKMDVTIDGSAYSLTSLDFSAATSYADVASTVTTAIATAAGSSTTATLTYDATPGRFVLEEDVAQADTMTVSAVTSGTDVGDMLHLIGAKTINSPGALKQTPIEAFQASEAVSDSFGSSSFGASIDLADAVDVATYVANQNVKYQHYWSVTRDTGASDPNAANWSAALIGIASNGLVLNETSGEHKEALPQAVMAATDYDRPNATINYMFRRMSTLTPEVKKDLEADSLDAKRINYYGQTATAGQNISFFQRGVLCGLSGDPTDMSVHATEQWFKSTIKADLMNLLLQVSVVPANNDGRAMVLGGVQNVENQAVINGTIITGKDLTESQKIAITSGSGDLLAWHDVQTNGYWMDARIELESGSYVAYYTVYYSKGDAVRKIE